MERREPKVVITNKIWPGARVVLTVSELTQLGSPEKLLDLLAKDYERRQAEEQQRQVDVVRAGGRG